MKKNILLSAILLLWAALPSSAISLPPYGETYAYHPFYLDIDSDQPEQDINIYPNPVTEGRLTIKSVESFKSVQIMNITGEIVFNQDYPSGSVFETIEMDKIEKGMYLVRIVFSGRANFTGKIIVK